MRDIEIWDVALRECDVFKLPRWPIKPLENGGVRISDFSS
jgi:hypothetical protein